MGALDPWFALHNDPASIRMMVCGDSTSFGSVTVTNGGWPEQLRLLANSRWGKGGDGLHQVGASDTGRNWATSNGSYSAGTDAWAGGANVANVWHGSASTHVATWTKPASLTPTSFDLVVIDGASAADIAYSVDGGTTWTNAGLTGLTGSNTAKNVRIAAPITSTLKVRGANASGTSADVYLVGIVPYTNSPGLIVDNVAVNSSFLSAAVTPGGRPWTDLIDLLQPQLATIMFTNDVLLFDAATYQSELEAFYDAVASHGGAVLFMNFFEQAGRDVATQASLRAATKAAATAKSMPIIDFYDLVGDNAAAVAAGYMNTSDIHPNNAGAVFMAQQIWKALAASRIGVALAAA